MVCRPARDLAVERDRARRGRQSPGVGRAERCIAARNGVTLVGERRVVDLGVLGEQRHDDRDADAAADVADQAEHRRAFVAQARRAAWRRRPWSAARR